MPSPKSVRKSNPRGWFKLAPSRLIKTNGKFSKGKLAIIVTSLVGIALILFQNAYAGNYWNAWTQPWVYHLPIGAAYGTTIESGAFCSWNAGTYSIWGPYDSFWVTNPSGMDVTMEMVMNTGVAGDPFTAKIDISGGDGRLVIGSTYTGKVEGGDFFVGIHLKQGYYYHIEYRMFVLSGTVCTDGYHIYTK